MTMDDSSYASDLVANTATPVSSTSSSASLTPEMVQQMIVNAFTALRLSGKTKSSTWYLDSGASNHMAHSAQNLSSFKTQDVRETQCPGPQCPKTALIRRSKSSKKLATPVGTYVNLMRLATQLPEAQRAIFLPPREPHGVHATKPLKVQKSAPRA